MKRNFYVFKLMVSLKREREKYAYCLARPGVTQLKKDVHSSKPDWRYEWALLTSQLFVLPSQVVHVYVKGS